MKVRTIGQKYLMITLSRSETDFLGIAPGAPLESFRSKYILTELFLMACSYCRFAAEGSKVDIQILSGKDGETVLLFQPLKRKRYRLSGDRRPYICIFQDCDAYIAFMEQAMKKELPAAFRVFLHEGKYIAAVAPDELSGELRTLLGEFGKGKRISVRCCRELQRRQRVL